MTLDESLSLLGLPEVVTDGWQAQLGEPQRHYHTLAHIAAMLAQLDAAEATRDLVAAIWLHDIVYDPKSATNEADSAEQALRDLADVPGIDAAEVARLILGTKRHEGGCAMQDLLNDLDLGILGASETAYRRYADQIRAEYAFVPPDVYAPARAALLRAFDQRRIFRTERFAHLEAPAHRNLAQEIVDLEGA